MTRYREKFHQAARDGYLDLLREATKSEADGPDENGMSPVMWAAFYGNLDALRLLFQRGGSPDKTDHMGSTALHFAALNGHMHCVTYLVNFGANIWTLDNDFHTALDLAGLREHRDIVEYLDGVAGKQASLNRRVVTKLREKAALEAQKRVKKFDRMLRKTSKKAAKADAQANAQQQQQHLMTSSAAGSTTSASSMLKSAGGGTTSNPNYQRRGRHRSFSYGGGADESDGASMTGSVVTMRTQQRTHSNGAATGSAGPRPYSEYLTSSRSGYRGGGRHAFGAARKVVNHKQHHRGADEDPLSNSFSDVVYARTSADGRSVLSGPTSEPDMQLNHQQGAGLFERPGFGSVAFFHRHHPANSLAARTLTSSAFRPDLTPPTSANSAALPSPEGGGRAGSFNTDSIGTSRSLLRRWRDLPWAAEDVDNLEDDYDDGEDGGGRGPDGTLVSRRQLDLELFLACLCLTDCMPALVREQIDLDALGLCSEADLQSLGLPLGPRKKILEAVQRRKEAFDVPGCMTDLRL